MDRISNFRGQYSFLSNFYPCPVEFENEIYGSAEAAFQAAKTTNPIWRQRIRNADSPKEAKQLGKQCPLRLDWNRIRVDIMKEILVSKFSAPALKEKLAATGTAFLEESNTWGDRFWGTVDGIGTNILGKLLMEIRDGRDHR